MLRGKDILLEDVSKASAGDSQPLLALFSLPAFAFRRWRFSCSRLCRLMAEAAALTSPVFGSGVAHLLAAPGSAIKKSVRRFFSRPSSVALSAIGQV